MSSDASKPADGADEATVPGDSLTSDEIRSRAIKGIGAVGIRALGVRGLGLLVNIGLARLLMPSDFGLLAFGQTIVMFGSLLTDVGLAASLIRQRDEPKRDQLRALMGLQLATTIGLTAVLAAVLLPFGRTGLVALLMVLSLSVAAIGGTRVVLLERRLDYQAIATADIASAVVYSALAIGLVAGGLGIWGVVIAHVGRASCQSAILVYRTRDTHVTPKLAWKPLRGMIGFGAQYQLNTLFIVGREQGINLLTLLLASTTVLGYWSLAQRLLMIPFLLFEALWRVSFPVVSRLLAQGADPREDLNRAIGLGALATSLTLVGIAGSASIIIPVVFGDTWDPAASVVAPASLGIIISGPISAAGAGYLFAAGKPRRVLCATGASLVAWLVLLPILLPTIGIEANGFAWLAACLVEAAVLADGLRRHAGVHALRAIAVPTLIGVVVAAAVAYLSRDLDATVLNAAMAGGGGTLAYLALTVALYRRGWVDLISLSRRAVRRA